MKNVRNTILALALLAGTAPAAFADDRQTTIDHAAGGRTTVTSDSKGTRAERDGGAGGSHNRGDSSRETHRDMVREHTHPGDRVREDRKSVV